MLAKRSHFLLAALTAVMLLGNGAQAAEATTTLGPNGEQPTPYTQVTLTTAQQDRVKAQHYTAAILMHTTSDWSSALIKGAKDRFHDLNVKVVAVTDAEFNANKQRTDVETVMAMAPDIILTLVVDPVSGAAAFRPAVQQGSKLVLISNLPTGFEYGKDYAGIVTDDLFEMGGLAADMLAKTVGEQGKIGFIYHEANYYVTNTQHPDIQAIYAPWDSIAEGVVAATRAAGRSDIKVITMDLGAANALDMAKGRNVAGIVTDLPYDLGQTLATMGALAKLGEQTPPFVTVSADAVTRDNLADAWQQALRRDPPAAVTKALSQ